MIDKEIFDFVDKGQKGIVVNPREKTLGHYVCVGPTNRMVGEDENANQIVKLNFTGPPGTASALYYSLFFMLYGDGFHVVKTNEWIEVSPSYPQYYQVTAGSKKQLEGQIKEGIASAAAAVADYELVLHDKRKYEQYMDILNRKDEQSLRAVFIDQVDIHTDVQGYPSALRSIVSRWPTIIVDFQKLDEKDDKPNDVAKKLGISEAESVILVTKNKLYKTWKEEFKKSVMRRFESLTGLENARKKSIEEYRKWIKPYIARYRMTRLGGESVGGRAETMKSFADLAGTSTFSNEIQIWAWKALKTQEPRKAPIERESKFLLNPYDSWVRNELILNEKTGLASLYPWLRNPRKYCPKCKKYYLVFEKACKECNGWLEDRYHADEIVETDIIKTWEKKEMSLNPSEMYYTFFVIDVFRSGSWLKIGEIEDISFVVSCYLVSQNVLLVKLLEMKCREREFEMYIDEILGISLGEEDIPSRIRKDFPDLFEKPKPETEREKFDHELRMLSKNFNTLFSGFKIPSVGGFSKPGQYETDFLDRITKYYLSVTGGEFKAVKEFLKSNMGVG